MSEKIVFICRDQNIRQIITETLAQYDDIAPVVFFDSRKQFQSQDTENTKYATIVDHQENPDLEQNNGKTFILPVRMGEIIDWALERPPFEEQALVTMGRFTLDTAALCLNTKKSGDMVRLTEKERDILLCLWNARPNSVERDVLLDEVWGYADGLDTHTLETHIYRLRQKIEEAPSEPQFLVTDEKGYKLVI